MRAVAVGRGPAATRAAWGLVVRVAAVGWEEARAAAAMGHVVDAVVDVIRPVVSTGCTVCVAGVKGKLARRVRTGAILVSHNHATGSPDVTYHSLHGRMHTQRIPNGESG